ncbi:hypothetical protein DFH07DRAFT_822569 [Mycena maculata]|uniref:Uncharacterized protein n=1 Tax=Mycena maculata TaxID=230809 RepID=A0AAD7NBN1_9AGAR|nr:hypothetical protein DFH07DRAFT_822569 [Mycena maculata]
MLSIKAHGYLRNSSSDTMAINTHLVLTTLLALISCATGKVVQYVLLSVLVSYSAFLLARPFLPSARMTELEELIAETTDLLQQANEERVLPNRAFNLAMQLRLSRVNRDKSGLRSKILGFRLGYPMQEYLHMAGVLSREIQRCRREAKEIQVAILVCASANVIRRRVEILSRPKRRTKGNWFMTMKSMIRWPSFRTSM